MKLGKTLYVKDRGSWRNWLSKHHGRENEIWLVYPRKCTGIKRISYNDAVEEALCFGWIDSTVKRVDDEKFAQRFSPRKSTSQLSQMNRERIRKLILENRMTPAGLAAVSHVFRANSKERFVVPTDMLSAIKKNKTAWENFKSFPDSYKRIRVAYIESRRRHGREAFQKSLQNFIGMTAKNKRIGFVKEWKQ